MARELRDPLPTLRDDYPARTERDGDRRLVRLRFPDGAQLLAEYLRTVSRGGLILRVERPPSTGADVVAVLEAPSVFPRPVELAARVAMVRPDWLGLVIDASSEGFVRELLPAVTLAAEVHRAWGHRVVLRAPPAEPGARRAAARVATQLTYGSAWGDVMEDSVMSHASTVAGEGPADDRGAALLDETPSAAHFWAAMTPGPEVRGDAAGWWGEAIPEEEAIPTAAAPQGAEGALLAPATPAPPPSPGAWRDNVFGEASAPARAARPGRRPVRPTSSELTATISPAHTPPPLAPDDPLRAGDLSATPAGLVLVEIWRQHRSGRLTLENMGRRVEVDLRGGMVVSIALPTRPGARIGDILVARGALARAAAEAAATAASGAGQLMGEALVSQGAVDRQTLGRALDAQLSARLESLAALNQGVFTFDEGVPPKRQALRVGVSPGVEVTAALARRFSRRTLLQMHEHDEAYRGAVAVVSPGSEGLIGHAGLEAAGAGELLELIRAGTSRVPALYRATNLSPRLAHAWTHALHQVGLVDLLPPE